MLFDDHYIHAEENVPGVIVAFVNARSGERAAADFVQKQLIKHLGKEKVFDLFPLGKPAIEEAKEFIIQFLPEIIIVAGGDGTVSLALDITDNLRKAGKISDTSASVAILPMGTGNDLSRTLGFGGGYVKPINNPESKFHHILHRITSAKKIKMDRWSLTIQKSPNIMKDAQNENILSKRNNDNHNHNHNEIIMNPKSEHSLHQSMMNYFSIGFDAAIATQFSTFRDNHPTLCKQRAMNKMWYGCLGCQSMCTAPTLPRQQIKLKVDHEIILIPPGVKGLVVSNVSSYAGGAVLWGDTRGRFNPPSVGDELLEISALYGAWHIAGVQTGVRRGLKLAQGRIIELTAPVRYAMQCDGEPVKIIKEGEGNTREMMEVRITLLSTTLVMRCEEGESEVKEGKCCSSCCC